MAVKHEFKIEILSDEVNENFRHMPIDSFITIDREQARDYLYKAFKDNKSVNLYVDGYCLWKRID